MKNNMFDYDDDFYIDEKFTSEHNKQSHYDKHVIKKKEFGKISADEYEKIAEELQTTPVDNKNIFGYMSLRDDSSVVYCKYNKKTEVFVVYTYNKQGEPLTITCYTKPWGEYTGTKAMDYFDEIPEGK